MRPAPRHQPRLSALLLALFVTLLWSTSWVLIKIGLRGDLPPITFAGLRYTLAFVCLAPFVLLHPRQRAALRALQRRDWLVLGSLGLVVYALTQGAMFMALDSLPANTVSLLLNLTSVFVALAGTVVLREMPGRLQWAGIGLVAVGVGVYFLPAALPPAQVTGSLIGLFCMLMNVAAALFGRSVNRAGRYAPILVTFVSMGVGSLAMLLTGLLSQGPGHPSPQAWAIIAWLAVANTALAFTLWNRTLRVLTAVESSILNSLMMPQIALLAVLFLGETLSPRQLVGLGLVFVGVLAVQIRPQTL